MGFAAAVKVLQQLAASSQDACLAKTRATRLTSARPKNPVGKPARMSIVVSSGVKIDLEAQSLWHEVATASDEVAAIVDRIPGLTVTGVETRNELERAAALLKAVAVILRRTERREARRHAKVNRSILGPDPIP